MLSTVYEGLDFLLSTNRVEEATEYLEAQMLAGASEIVNTQLALVTGEVDTLLGLCVRFGASEAAKILLRYHADALYVRFGFPHLTPLGEAAAYVEAMVKIASVQSEVSKALCLSRLQLFGLLFIAAQSQEGSSNTEREFSSRDLRQRTEELTYAQHVWNLLSPHVQALISQRQSMDTEAKPLIPPADEELEIRSSRSSSVESYAPVSSVGVEDPPIESNPSTPPRVSTNLFTLCSRWLCGSQVSPDSAKSDEMAPHAKQD